MAEQEAGESVPPQLLGEEDMDDEEPKSKLGEERECVASFPGRERVVSRGQSERGRANTHGNKLKAR